MTTRKFYLSFVQVLFTLSMCVTVINSNAQRGVVKIIALAEQFEGTLSSAQVESVQLPYTFANIKTWSNLPASMSRRLGIRLGDLNASQLVAAKALIKEMSGTTANEGWDEVQQIWAADD